MKWISNFKSIDLWNRKGEALLNIYSLFDQNINKCFLNNRSILDGVVWHNFVEQKYYTNKVNVKLMSYKPY